MSSPDTEVFSYSGTKALENMNEAINYNRALTELLLRTGATKGSSILDFGAGVGTFSKILRDRGYNPLCVEIDKDECAHLRADGFTVFENLDDVPDESCDLIYSLNVLEHIEDHVGVMTKLQKKLKPTGKLFIYVPAFQLLYSDFDAMLGHFRRYHIPDLRKVLVDSGYTIEKIRYYDTLGFLAAYVFKLLKAKPDQVTKGKIWFFDRIVFPCNRIADPILRHWFGKNIYAVCGKNNSAPTNE